MRADEGKKCRILLAIKMKARTVVGSGKSLLICRNPGSELRLGREKENKNCKENPWENKKINK